MLPKIDLLPKKNLKSLFYRFFWFYNFIKIVNKGNKHMININEILVIYKEEQVDKFLEKYTKLSLNESNLKEKDITNYYEFVGRNKSNGSIIGQLTTGEKGLVERITNGIDAVIEKEKERHNIRSAKDANVIIKKAFPKYYDYSQRVLEDKEGKMYIKDARNLVSVSIYDGSQSNKPTFDIIDKGTGISAKDFRSTVLSLNHGNKISSDKSYLIGAFGQGGSTSLAFTYATIILSKKDNKMAFTIIKRVDLKDYKNIPYVFMKIDNQIPEVDYSNYELTGFEDLDDFVLNAESGTLVRMIETDINIEYRRNPITKPLMLVDYLNTELFNVGLPVKMNENRKNYEDRKDVQDRNIYGSFMKLQTYRKNVKKDYCGTIDIDHNNRPYKIKFYIILPTEENDWGNDSKCRDLFKQFNIYEDPIIYTVNGQTITTEKYTKLQNAGLNFLKYRLLVVIDLDTLGNEKYKFFTSDRSRIVSTDLSKGLIDRVVVALKENQKLIEMNSIIADKSISASIDDDVINDIAKRVKNQYSKFLIPGAKFPSNSGKKYEPSEDVFFDEISSLTITSLKREFYKNENISFTLMTKANASVNKNASINAYINDSSFNNYIPSFMNGRIEYQINAGDIKPGDYQLQFIYYKENFETISSNTIQFIVLNENKEDEGKKSAAKNLDIEIIPKDNALLICEIVKNEDEKKIYVFICLETNEMKKEIYGKKNSKDDIAVLKNKILEPIVLFALFYGKKYDEIETDEEKNALIIAFIKTFISNMDKN